MHDGELIDPWEPTHRITVVSTVTGERSKPYEVMLSDGEGPAYTREEWRSNEDASWSYEDGEWQYQHALAPPPDHGLSSTRGVYFEVVDLEERKAKKYLADLEKRASSLEDAILAFLQRTGALAAGNNLPRPTTETLIHLLSKA